ncbi:MAG: deoxyribodipyrimidine photo-lyase [Gammaproteobacteria bacterium]|nr:deoxyribodipyrimidine photo-lyase [Gammaproteobacteria bacterium]MCY4275247.1 deoxyribodipyrimidine photo-lyase [Gammaproteobacteria bacterium]
MTISVVWLRRDFRLCDNPAICYAIDYTDQVILLYIHAPHEEQPWQPGAASNWWLHQSLCAFKEQVQKKKGNLIIRQGDSLKSLVEVCTETRATTVCWNRLYEPSIINRDQMIKKELEKVGIRAVDFPGALLREPSEVVKEDGGKYRVYTPFSKRHASLAPPELPFDEPDQLTCPNPIPNSLQIEELKLIDRIQWYSEFTRDWQPGEIGAHQRLQSFSEIAIQTYGHDRDIPNLEGVSRLSPHLHFGEVSPRQVWLHIRSDDGSLHDSPDQSPFWPYLRQLIWRDFAHHLLQDHPSMSDLPLDPMYKTFIWEENPELLQKWQSGQTGIPLVDAGMRQLWRTGWMHNRVRMIVASLLCKNGLIHWLEGARWFWATLVDADLANNSMGWQWVAGCGPDAAPYFRIFSPKSQGQRFDPEGEYIRRWVPELSEVPTQYIHEPWTWPEWKDSPKKLNYTLPVIDLKQTRQRALNRYHQIKHSWMNSS